jgi:signal transduction histidine kinase
MAVFLAYLSEFYLRQRQQQVAAMEEQIRLAGEIYDRLFQSLTGISLQLDAIARLLTKDPEEAGSRLRDLQEAIAAEQRDLRHSLQQLKQGSPTQ